MATLVSGARGTPLMKRTPKAMQLRTMAVPMSGCLMISAADTISMPMTGAITCLAGAERSILLTTTSAAKATRASFISSEGWSRSIPNPIHLDEPPAVTPRPGTRTATRRRRVPPASGTDQARHLR